MSTTTSPTALLAVYLLSLETYEAQIGACHDALEAADARGLDDVRQDPTVQATRAALDSMAPPHARIAYHLASHGKRTAHAEETFTAAHARETALARQARDIRLEVMSDEEREEEAALAWAERRAEGF